MILVDSNVFMYAGGSAHPYKEPSQKFLRQIAAGELDAAIDAEVLQEILHRYRAINRWTEGTAVFEQAVQIIANVIPINRQTLIEAHALMKQYLKLTARDALHAAVYVLEDAEALCSFDRDFDQIDGLVRKEPGELLL